MSTNDEKFNCLKKTLSEMAKDGIILAYSGGVDSELLLHMMSEYEKVAAVTFDNGLYSKEEIAYASSEAEKLGVRHIVLKFDSIPYGMEYNPYDRCYICKKSLFMKAREVADNMGFRYLIDGTNLDDLKLYRPGKKALDEMDVVSPLAKCEIGKRTVREFAEKIGVKAFDKPSTPCLATRIPYGKFLDENLLTKISCLEDEMRKLGYDELRLRFHDPIMRIEIPTGKFEKIIGEAGRITEIIKRKGFIYVCLDLEGLRSGSMDIERNGE